MSTFADQAVIAIETLRLFNEVQERTAETERTRKVMQTAFDNMGDGVALLDKDLRLQFMSQERIKSRQFPPELVQPGVPARELMLFQARRGDYGPVASEADVERKIKAAFARMTTPGGTRYVRPENGRYIEFNFKPISDGGILAVFRDITELQEREEARREADVERTRIMQTVLDNMSDGVTLFDKDYRLKFTNQRLIDFLQLPPDVRRAGPVAAGHPALPGQARRLRPGRGRREAGAGAVRFIAQAGRLLFRAPHGRRPLSRVQLHPAARRRHPRGRSATSPS